MSFPILDEHHGVAVDLQQRNAWAKEVIQHLTEDPKQQFSYVCSGDSITFGYRVEDEGVIEIYDTRIVRTTIILENVNAEATA